MFIVDNIQIVFFSNFIVAICVFWSHHVRLNGFSQ